MAEVLGLASGIITVVETAGKLGSTALRLKRLWDEIQDVPDMIKLHMERLQMLAPALDDMEDQFRHTRAVVERDVAAQQSLEYCRKAFATLESLVIDLGKQIASSKKGKRTMAKFKVVLKKTTIQGYERQLEYAMDLAVFSQQSYMIALNRAQHSIVMSEFKALRTLQYLREPRKSRAVEEESDGDELPDSQALTQQVATRYAAGISSRPRVKKNQSTPLGSQKWFTYEISEVSNEGSPVVTSQVYNGRFRLPLWFIEKVWDFQIHKSYMGWKFDLKSWCIRPHDSPIFRHAMFGDIEQVLAAFSTNEASLYDRGEDGRTLLDMATIAPQIELSKLLMHLGLRNENESGLRYLCDGFRMNFGDSGILDFYRFMDDKGCFEDDLVRLLDPDCEVSINMTSLSTIWWVPGAFDLIRDRHLPNFDQIPRSSALFKIDRWERVNTRILLNFLVSSGRFTPSSFRRHGFGVLLTHPSRLIIGFFNEYMATYHERYSRPQEAMRDMRELTRWIFTGASPREVFDLACQRRSFCQELYQSAFHQTWRRTGKFIQPVFLMWIQDLGEAGVDLEEYGRLEASLLANELMLYTNVWSVNPTQCFVSLEYGPCLEDWKIEFDPRVEQFAGEFWDMIAKEEELMPGPMPGAWID